MCLDVCNARRCTPTPARPPARPPAPASPEHARRVSPHELRRGSQPRKQAVAIVIKILRVIADTVGMHPHAQIPQVVAQRYARGGAAAAAGLQAGARKTQLEVSSIALQQACWSVREEKQAWLGHQQPGEPATQLTIATSVKKPCPPGPASPVPAAAAASSCCCRCSSAAISR